jgi:peptidoglycan L-alanyl-D-glutamate endopeptidase CwlK
LNPRVQKKADSLLSTLNAKGIDARLGETFRTTEQQNQKFLMGSSTTTLRGGESYHNFALAFDIKIYTPNGQYITNGSNPLYTTAGEIGKSLGLTWGGDWIKPFDPSHFQLTAGLTKAQIKANIAAGIDPLCNSH